jgi:hypothetical protein
VFIPPLMPLTPATLSRIVQFTTLVICLFAVASMFLNGLVEFMFRVSDSALTPVEVFCVEAWHCREKQKRRQYGSSEHRCCCGKKFVRTIHAGMPHIVTTGCIQRIVAPMGDCGFVGGNQIRAASRSRLRARQHDYC